MAACFDELLCLGQAEGRIAVLQQRRGHGFDAEVDEMGPVPVAAVVQVDAVAPAGAGVTLHVTMRNVSAAEIATPKTTAMPIGSRDSAPAPVPSNKGKAPKAVQALVINGIVARIFHALRRVRERVWLNVQYILTNVVGNILLVRVLATKGLAISSSAAIILHLVLALGASWQPVSLAAAAASSPPMNLERLHPGSWINSVFATWIGHPDKNRAWDMLGEAKAVYDHALGKKNFSTKQLQELEIQLAVCEGSDWFWWFGDYNPGNTVSDFERLFRQQLTHLYDLLGEPAPDYLSKVFTVGGGEPALGGAMRKND